MQAHHHSVVFGVLSVTIATLGSWTALDLFRRVEIHVGQGRNAWLTGSALVMGLSIWSMHFVAMLGFNPGTAVSYDPALTLLSLGLAVGATAGAFYIAAERKTQITVLVGAGVAMGVGICMMHYVGMAAVRTARSLGYDLRFVAASLVIAITASTAALFGVRREHTLGARAAAAVLLGGAIAGMHYTAMAGLRLAPPSPTDMLMPGAPPTTLAVSVAAGTVIILFIALVASLYDQRSNVLSALEASSVGYWELDWRSRQIRLSAQARHILGSPDRAVIPYDDLERLVRPEDRGMREAALQETLATGAPYDVEYQLAQERRWVNVRGRVIDRVQCRLSGVMIDVTDRRDAFAAVLESERRQRLLIDELNHRVKNTLATVQSIATQTVRRAATLDAFQMNFEGRLMALSSTHDALTRGGWETADLREILEREFRPYRADQIILTGSAVELTPRQALSLGMVLHELATNAAKYGALSVAEGRLEVAWTVAKTATGGDLMLDWTEAGGPRVRPPKQSGFGSRLIATSIERELGGRATLLFAPDGLRCSLLVPCRTPRQLDSAVERVAY